ncbi:MAG: acyl-CoA thioesterase domain-containing protein [Actinomycetota bacterium]
MPSVAELLGAEAVGEGAFRFEVPVSLHGAFGGAFGGIVAACTLITARSVVSGRVPNALDIRFMRGLRAGGAVARGTVLHSGRSLSNVSVDLRDEGDRLCARATISLVDPSVLQPVVRPGPQPGAWKSHDEATPWPAVAPIVATIDSRLVGNDGLGYATAMKIPWDVAPDSSAESACMAADMAVGPPLGALASDGASTPNPDLSLRFCGEVTEQIVVGLGRLDRAAGGVAAVGVQVWSGAELVATGVSTALMIPLP